ncbi:MAG: hypothetical protein FWB96_06935 [Defluviitaleaceae bacterium]|nr:hypothetical protein [Defluviitaleaceae bacterium]MCL2262996.1 hypothetical protein [Defluviitaleaceae bacterium]
MKGRLTNPVVYFMLGSCNEFAPPIASALDTYVTGAEIIKVPQGVGDEYIRGEVNRVWREFLTNGAGRADIIRANFFVCADETALALPELLVSAEKYFSALFPAGVLVDIYCLLDDADLLAPHRQAVMEMLAELREGTPRIYLLSNLSSTNTFETREKAAQTAALLTLFKDCSPNLYISEADAARYNEFFFLENCAARNGDFLTAGSLVLSVPQDALKALIMAEILTFGRDDDITEETETPHKSVFPQKMPAKSMDYLCGLAIPDFNLNDPLTRGAWISRLFGQRLEQIASEYDAPETETDDVFTPPPQTTNLYELIRQAEEVHGKAASDAVYAAENELRKAEEKLDAWLESRPDFTKGSAETATRRLSPLQTQPLFPYVLAQEFLKKQADLQYIKEKINILQRRQRVIARYLKKIFKLKEQVDAAVSLQERQILQLNETFRAFTGGRNAADYFRKKFREYAKINRDKIENLSREMTDSLLNNEFAEFQKSLESFVKITVLSAPQFTESIATVLQELTGGDDISAALSEWILQHIHFGVRLKTGYAKLYTEANLFMPEADTAFEVKKQYEARGLGRMTVFISEDTSANFKRSLEAVNDSSSGSASTLFAPDGGNGLAVLYHAGAFNLEELFYVVSEK